MSIVRSDFNEDGSYVRDHDRWHREQLAALRASGLTFEERPEAVIFREPGGPFVDFYPSTGRWRVVGKGAPKQTFRGGVEAFLGWYAKQRRGGR